jgi:hypothetical protein
MSGKMNWERVRKEGLARAHGSEWADPPEVILPASADGGLVESRQTPERPRRSRYRVTTSVASGMVGCTCGKAVGFWGAHKKKCPKSRPQFPALYPSTRL